MHRFLQVGAIALSTDFFFNAFIPVLPSQLFYLWFIEGDVDTSSENIWGHIDKIVLLTMAAALSLIHSSSHFSLIYWNGVPHQSICMPAGAHRASFTSAHASTSSLQSRLACGAAAHLGAGMRRPHQEYRSRNLCLQVA